MKRIVGDAYRLVIPNKEIKKVFASEILAHLQTTLKFNQLKELRLAIIDG